MRLLLALMFVFSTSVVMAEEVSTDCPWANQDNRNAGKVVKAPSSQSSKGRSKVTAE